MMDYLLILFHRKLADSPRRVHRLLRYRPPLPFDALNPAPWRVVIESNALMFKLFSLKRLPTSTMNAALARYPLLSPHKL